MTTSPEDFIVPVLEGERPLSPAQFNMRILNRKRRVLTESEQAFLLALAPEQAAVVAVMMQSLVAAATTNNQFNHAVQDCRKAVARLARMQLSQGQPEIYEDQETGEFDENGDPVLESVLVQRAVEPLPATVEQITYDETGEAITAMIPNPALVQDDLERAAAQAVIAATPENVKEFTQ